MSWKRPNNGSRMNREVHVRFWESPGVKVLRATRHLRRYGDVRSLVCYRRYRTLLRPTETRVLVAFLRGCNESARKLLPGLFAWFLSDRNFREGQRRTGDSILSSARHLLRDRRRIARSPEECLQLGEVGVGPQLPRRRQCLLRNLDLAPEMTCVAKLARHAR